MKKQHISNTARLITLALLVAPTLTWANDCQQADRLYNRSLKVEQDLLKAIDLCPNHVYALNNLATLREKQGQLAKAQWLYKRAIKADPNFAHPYAGLGDVLMQREDYRKAADMFDQFLTKANGDSTLQPYVKQYEARLKEAQNNITVSATEIETALTHTRTIGPAKVKVEDKVDIPLNFATNSSKVSSKKARRQCKKMATAILKVLETNGLQNSQIRIEGHTDSRGRASYNKKLSQRRANSVKNELVNDFKVPADRLIAVGQGEYRPIASNKTGHGRFLNRRVTLVRID